MTKCPSEWNAKPTTEQRRGLIRPTPLDELRKPHPEQARIDADGAALLRARQTCVGDALCDRESDRLLEAFEDAQADQDSREGWASDDCAYPD